LVLFVNFFELVRNVIGVSRKREQQWKREKEKFTHIMPKET